MKKKYTEENLSRLLNDVNQKKRYIMLVNNVMGRKFKSIDRVALLKSVE